MIVRRRVAGLAFGSVLIAIAPGLAAPAGVCTPAQAASATVPFGTEARPRPR